MIDCVSNQIDIDRVVHDITSWEVWWVTPFGLHIEKQEAFDRLKEADMDMNLARPVAVAVVRDLFPQEGQTGEVLFYEVAS